MTDFDFYLIKNVDFEKRKQKQFLSLRSDLKHNRLLECACLACELLFPPIRTLPFSQVVGYNGGGWEVGSVSSSSSSSRDGGRRCDFGAQ